ncbi:hypothetical protein CONPUDRAFT_151520 [Coniophora puteana RWD-64-598 SS2]|uniref:Cytochrome P450 n=1 Tax=Coniophora puteana (strain RWD-64-598) TaxID=741705 RepID=A0A5M3N0S4_CONPW|nr:uncharacterized protein CONPUDRAFT_151520 [Coniophora puteana RWD-64-598 SS2]EIW84505.1 hypothetical protein CONPUDRAFT_151520 [Coniophora puteana RWD-64-598 SS2]
MVFLVPTLNDDTLMLIWGFGRRICPGRNFAVNSVWIAIARLLAQFIIDFEPEFVWQDVEVEWANATTSVLKDFPRRIVPRRVAKVG